MAKVLVIGGGRRREHALAWKFAQSPQVEKGLCGTRQSRHGGSSGMHGDRRTG